MKRGCSLNEGCGGDPPDERELPKKYLTNNGKGRAPDPPRVPIPPPKKEEQGPEELVGTCVAACQAQSHARSARNAGSVNFQEYLSISGFFVSVFSLLHLRWVMMMICTCKFFSSSNVSDDMLTIAKNSLFLTFPKLSSIPPSMKFVDLRRMYVDYFMDASGESLFADHGFWVLNFWLNDVPRNPPSGSHPFSNIPNNIAVLSRAGFFSTLYSRWRLYKIAVKFFHMALEEIIRYPLPGQSDDISHWFKCTTLRQFINCEFIRRLCLDSYEPSSCPTYSDSWLRFPMHFRFLGPSSTPWQMGIRESDVKDFNDTFGLFSRNPTMEGLRSGFPLLQDHGFPLLQDEEVMNHILEHMRFASTLPNDITIGPNVFPPDHDNVGVFYPFAWEFKPDQVTPLVDDWKQYRVRSIVGDVSTYMWDKKWGKKFRMCRKSEKYGDGSVLISLKELEQIAKALEVAELPSEDD
jgi:hypothetical protein